MDERKPIYKPMPGRLVVRLHQEEMIGRFVLPVSAQRSKSAGTVLAIGDDEAEGEDWNIKVGDFIIFGMNSGIRTTVGREEILFLRTSEVLCVLEWEEGETPPLVRDQHAGVWDGVPDD